MADTSTSTKSPSISSGAKSATSMADLMASYKTSFKTFHKGDYVTGKITKLTKNEVLVDIESKTEGIVLEKERSILNTILSTLKVGDEVQVSVLSPESENGHPIVSLRRYLSTNAWEQLELASKDEKQIEVTVSEVTKGGMVAVTESGLSGFLPNSHVAGSEQHLTPGKKIKVRVLELSRKDNKLVFSQKSTISLTDFEEATKGLTVDGKAEVSIMNITAFGMFVTVPVPNKTITLDGLIHISELAWEKVEDINQLYATGQKIEAVVLGFDKNARRVDLSVKRLTEDPFEAIIKQYPVDTKVAGTVLRIDESGAYIELAEGVEGMIKKEKIPANMTLKEGQTVNATVSELDKRRHRIVLLPVLLEKPLMYR